MNPLKAEKSEERARSGYRVLGFTDPLPRQCLVLRSFSTVLSPPCALHKRGNKRPTNIGKGPELH